MAELQGKVVLSAHELREFQVLSAIWRNRKRKITQLSAKTV